MTEVFYQDRRCTIEVRRYPDGRPALVLLDARDGEELTVATVSLPGASAAPDEVFINNFENEDLLAALEAAGIVKATGEFVDLGFARIPRARVQPAFHHGFGIASGGGAEPRLGESAGSSEGPGVYQVWLNMQSTPTRINEIFGTPPPPFPNGFRHVADVEAESVKEAYRKAHADGNLLDPNDTSWKDWQKNQGVHVRVADVRGADFGDVIVSPDGQPRQLVNGGFRTIPRARAEEPHVLAEQRRTESALAVDVPVASPSAIAADNRPDTPTLSTGRTMGKKP